MRDALVHYRESFPKQKELAAISLTYLAGPAP
jgi:hypothetical protein